MPNNNNEANNRSQGNRQMNTEVKIGERVFQNTGSGLDENEIRAYVMELINQRDTLHKRQEHLSVLKELAEKTVIEANNLSQLMMEKATEQAKTEASKIKTQAEEESARLIKEKKAEAKAIADKEAEVLKRDVQQQVKTMREEQLKSIKSEAFVLAQKLQNDLLTSLDNIKKSVMAIGTNFENTGTATPGVKVYEAVKNRIPQTTLSEREKGTLLDRIPWLEIEIMPPMDIEKIMDLISQIESIPEVKTTDLLPETPNPLIRVFLNSPSPLAEMLRALPLVENVKEVTEQTSDETANGQEKRERIQLILGKNPNLPANKEGKKDMTTRTN